MLGGPKQQVDWSQVQTEFEAFASNEEVMDGGEAMLFENVVGGATNNVDAKLSKARMYAQRLGTTIASSSEGHVFVNGKYHVADDVCCHTLVLECDTKLYGTRIS
jgi:UDP-glucose:glycoprotein glucosyltransferase